ncbi:MAG: AAA family ATPase [Thermosynechococcaceae cyanobacterium]
MKKSDHRASIYQSLAQEMRSKFTLNDSQQQALEALQAFAEGADSFFVLEGYAGTGKTTLLQAFVAQLQIMGDPRSIVFSAFTNKATKVLAQMMAQWGLGVDCLTCCQLLGLRPQINPETGEQDFVPDKDQKSSFGKYDLVIVDECSMVNQNLWELLTTEVSCFYPSVQILFVGDSAQLPPVNETASQTFVAISNKALLTEVVRYGGAIGVLAESIRCGLESQRLPRLITALNDTQTEGTVVLKTSDWERQLVRAFSCDRSQADPDYVRALAYTNKRVNALNRQIRDAIFGAEVPRFVPEERLIAMHPIFGTEDEILMQTSSECVVEEAWEDESQGWRIWCLYVENDANLVFTLRVLHESEQARFTRELDQLAKAKQWQDFWSLKQRFASVNYSYALTIHKSQGSTFQNVFVDLPDAMRNRNIRERNQLLYVAVTRAAKRLFIRRY